MRRKIRYSWILPVIAGQVSAVILAFGTYEPHCSLHGCGPVWLVAINLVGGPGALGLLIRPDQVWGKQVSFSSWTLLTVCLFWFYIGWTIDGHRAGAAPKILVARWIRIALNVICVCVSMAVIKGQLDFGVHRYIGAFETLPWGIRRWGLFFTLQGFGDDLANFAGLLWAVAILLFSSWRLWVNCRPLTQKSGYISTENPNIL